MEKEKKEEVIKGLGITFLILSIIVILSYIPIDFRNKLCIEIIKIVLAVVYGLITIRWLFKFLLSLKEIKYYHWLHLSHVFFPIALVGRIPLTNQTLLTVGNISLTNQTLLLVFIIITQIVSIANIGMICCYYKKEGKKDIEDNIKDLRYSNLFLTYIFTFLLTAYEFCHYFKDSNSKRPILTFLFILPLLGLQVVYLKVEADKERKMQG